MSIPRKRSNAAASAEGRSDAPGNNTPKSSKVRVVGRIRPMAQYELRNGSQPIVTKVPGATRGMPETLQMDVASGDHANATNRWFELDAVLDESSTQKDVYETSGARSAIAEDLFDGYNATILAYGQTGSGKTFTMGTAPTVHDNDDDETNESDGVIPRACRDLFDSVKTKCDGQARVTCSYLEVYNEELRDLLVETAKGKGQQQPPLRIRETLDGQIYVRGLTERDVNAPKDVYTIMHEANQRRVVASTKMNATSSRSHAICFLKVKGVVVTNDNNDNDGISRTFEAKLTLVDLAGSERLKKTQAQGSRAKEGISINKGLFVLGQVVSSLAEKGRQSSTSKTRTSLPLRKPPYRDSKLTRLLQDSLGGNSRTIMIACVSPADCNAEETVNTLRYATQARNISNVATANLVETIGQTEARKLQRENALLKTQIAELEATIARLTQDVTDEDLERSMSLLQQQQQQEEEEEEDPVPSHRRERPRNGFEEEKKEHSGHDAHGDDNEMNDETTHASNRSFERIQTSARKNTTTASHNKKKSSKNNNNMALDDHFERSRSMHSSDEEIDDEIDMDEDKDSVSLLVDDVFENRSRARSVSRKGMTRGSSARSFASTRTLEEVEEENAELEARLLLAEKDVKAASRETAVELPKLKKRVRELEDSLSESKWLEHEARELQEQLIEARADKASAQRAAQQLASFMEAQKHQTGFRGDELTLEKVNYSRHKLNEDWVRFVVVVLNSFKEEMRLLGDYFQMVVQVVESPDILGMLGMLNNRERNMGGNAGVGWWKSKEQKEKELSAVAAEKELRSTLLREHISFFNARLIDIEDEVNLRSESIDVVLESLHNQRGQLEAEFGTQEEVDSIRDLYSKKGEHLLSQLTELMAGKLFNTSQRPTLEVT